MVFLLLTSWEGSGWLGLNGGIVPLQGRSRAAEPATPRQRENRSPARILSATKDCVKLAQYGRDPLGKVLLGCN